MSIKLVIFDWDGTLMDSQAKIVSCMQQAAVACELTPPTNNEVKHIIGISLLPAIKQLFNLGSDSDSEAASEPGPESSSEKTAVAIRDAYKKVFLETDQTPCPLFEGVKPMLDSIQAIGCDMAVATGKARRGLERAWESTNTGAYFINSRCADDAESKPSPDMLKQLLVAQGLTASQAIMVGDTSYDMQMAKDIGMKRIAVSYGVHDEAMLNTQTPTYMVHSIKELGEVLRTQLSAL